MPEFEDETAIRADPVPTDALRPLADGELTDEIIWAIVDAAPDGIVLADESGAILLVNRQAEELFGYDRGELLGRSVDDLLPERFQHVHRAHRTRYRVEPKTRSMGIGYTLFGRRQDGTEFPVEVSLSPMKVGGTLRIIAAVRDVSERIALESETRRVKDMLDATRDAVLIFDADTLRFIYANQGAVDQVGYSSSELFEMTMLHINPEFDEARLRDMLGPLERGEQTSVMFTSLNRHRDGRDIPVEIILQGTDIEDGRPRAFVKIVRDIGTRLADEARLREAEQGLRTMEDRDRIARDLHDVVIQRLFAVGLSVQALQARTPDSETARRLGVAVDELDETIREIRSVIFSLQSVSPGQRPGLRTEIVRVIDEQKSALGFEPRLQFDGVIDVAPWEIGEQLLPALREALSNIARHAHASSALVTITAGDRLTLRVHDDGIGIPADPVLGNGIANLRQRAADLGGSFEITASLDGGTTLEWSVPMGPDSR